MSGAHPFLLWGNVLIVQSSRPPHAGAQRHSQFPINKLHLLIDCRVSKTTDKRLIKQQFFIKKDLFFTKAFSAKLYNL